MEELNKVMESLTLEFLGSGTYRVSPQQFIAEKDAIFLDIRTNEEIETISLNLKYHQTVLRIPLNELPKRLGEIPKDKIVGLFCSSGVRIAMAYLYLRTAGFENVLMISGGLDAIISELKPGGVLKAVQTL